MKLEDVSAAGIFTIHFIVMSCRHAKALLKGPIDEPQAPSFKVPEAAHL